MNEQDRKNAQEWKGTVVSDAADKTIVVAVERFVTHPKYRKKYLMTKKYAVHDPANRYHVGDTVTFRASRPVSKSKRFTVVEA